jgi:dTDP-4-dehydrorhamnose reductase
MRVYLTGASGFVGSNIARVFAAHDAELITPGHEDVDLTQAGLVQRSVRATRPDAIVHTAIWNDIAGLSRDRQRAWANYVDATRHVVDAANGVGAQIVLVSTDWVFDGTQGPASETTPPNPINLYGFLKAQSELMVGLRADRGTVARIAGVQGVHWARPRAPRAQDAGFGYFVASLVDALRAGERFTVWDDCRINMRATPTLASDAAELIWRALEREETGILHCVGGEHSDRIELARRAAVAFDLDPDLLAVGPPDPSQLPAEGGVPFDTRLDATCTAEMLDVELPDLDTMLRRFRSELESARSAA